MSRGTEITVNIGGLAAVERQLERYGARLSDLDFRGIAREGMRLAAAFAPKRSGRLSRSIKANSAANKAVIRAGNATVKYAGPINYGWKARNIAASRFMQRADLVLRKKVPRELEAQIARIIARTGS